MKKAIQTIIIFASVWLLLANPGLAIAKANAQANSSISSNLDLNVKAQPNNNQLAKKIEEITNLNFNNALFGFILADAETGKIIYEHAANTNFVPASTAKLFVSAAALYHLTPEFRFATILKYQKKSLQQGTLNGPIALEFSGDPSFTSKHLNTLLAKIKQANIHTIKGDFIIDDSVFTGEHTGPGWLTDDLAWYYASPVSAIIVDGNTLELTITPSNQLGQTARAQITDPKKTYFPLNSALQTVTWQESETQCSLLANMDQDNRINLKGCWPVGNTATALKLAIQNPRKFLQEFLMHELAQANIKLTGKILFAKSANNMPGLAKHNSAKLSKLLARVLGDSNNSYAEALGKTLGAKLYKTGSFQTASLAIQNILEQPTGINFAALKLFDASGLSRYNLVEPKQLSRLLYIMYHNPVLRQYYINALALAGERGTLKNRLASFDTKKNIIAKTGTVRGVSALAGYINNKNNKTLIFTMLVNNSLLPAYNLKKIEDELCQLIINYTE